MPSIRIWIGRFSTLQMIYWELPFIWLCRIIDNKIMNNSFGLKVRGKEGAFCNLNSFPIRFTFSLNFVPQDITLNIIWKCCFHPKLRLYWNLAMTAPLLSAATDVTSAFLPTQHTCLKQINQSYLKYFTFWKTEIGRNVRHSPTVCRGNWKHEPTF